MITYVVCPHFYAFNNFMQKVNCAKCYKETEKSIIKSYSIYIFSKTTNFYQNSIRYTWMILLFIFGQHIQVPSSLILHGLDEKL